MNTFTSLKDIIYKTQYILNKKQKKAALLTFFVLLLSAFVELLGISCVLPFLQIIISPEKLLGNKIIVSICKFLNISTNTTSLVLLIGLFVIVVYFIKNIYLLFSVYVQNRFSTMCQRDISTMMLRSYMKQDYTFFVETNSSVILRGINADVDGLYSIIQNLFRLIAEILTAILIGTFLLLTDFNMAIIFIVLALFCVVLVNVLFRNRIKEYGIKRLAVGKECNKASLQAVMGIKEIMAANRTDYFVRRYNLAAEKRKRILLGQSFINAIPSKLIEIVCVTGLILLVCVQNTSGREMDTFIPQLGTFAVAAFRMLPTISNVSVCFSNLFFFRPSLESVYNNISSARIRMDTHQVGMTTKKENENKDDSDYVKVSNVNYRYPNSESNVLENLSLSIGKGEAIAIIGTSGAGKSTFVDVFLGLLEPQKGSIFLNDKRTTYLSEEWFDKIGYVPQAVYLLDDTIKNNVAFGIEEEYVDEALVWEALENAQLKEFVEGLPKKLDTIVGERGIKFSGGQRQRLSIARALYMKPSILVLDEATSALDTETESAVMDSINMLKGNLTLIIVAHRLSTISNCDTIYEIKDGKAIKRDKREVLSLEYDEQNES